MISRPCCNAMAQPTKLRGTDTADLRVLGVWLLHKEPCGPREHAGRSGTRDTSARIQSREMRWDLDLRCSDGSKRSERGAPRSRDKDGKRGGRWGPASGTSSLRKQNIRPGVWEVPEVVGARPPGARGRGGRPRAPAVRCCTARSEALAAARTQCGPRAQPGRGEEDLPGAAPRGLGPNDTARDTRQKCSLSTDSPMPG